MEYIILLVILVICGLIATVLAMLRKKPTDIKDVEIASLKSALEMARQTAFNPNDFVSKQVYFEMKKDGSREIALLLEGIDKIRKERAEIAAELEKIKSSRKSEQVRLGQIPEQIMPFLEGFKYDPKKLKPMFQPVDYICFDEEEIIFIEVKTGNSALSQKQKKIKQLIESGKVRFEIHRINENKYTQE